MDMDVFQEKLYLQKQASDQICSMGHSLHSSPLSLDIGLYKYKQIALAFWVSISLSI